MEWQPKSSVGPFRFGETLPSPSTLDNLALGECGSDPDSCRYEYEVEGLNVRVNVHYGFISFVVANRELRYRSKNLIGPPAAEVIALVGDRWEEPMRFPDGELRYLCPELGVVMWEDGGKVVRFVAAKPRIWDWVPDVRFGDIHFGEPLPQDVGLIYRRNERMSDDDEDRYDAVTHGVSISVDPNSSRVTGIITANTAKLQGKELIGREVEAAKSLIGGSWHDSGAGDSPLWQNDKKGIVLCCDSDHPDFVSGVILWGDFMPDIESD